MAVSNKNNNQIIIKKSYFDNIKTAIDSMNKFFASNFKDKDFPTVDAEFQVDGTIMNILSWLNNIEPAWIDDVSRVERVLNSLNESVEDMDGNIYEQLVNDNNKVVLDHINAFVGYKVLQFIADNFDAFGKFVNAIYTFEMFTHPSKYRDVIELFSQPIPIDEIDEIMGENTYSLFNPTKYVSGIFSNDQITLPKSLVEDNEIARFENLGDLENIEIVVDESVQEAAEVNYFEDIKPEHIKYNTKNGKWMISKQFEKAVNDLVAGLQKCDSTEDLKDLFGNSKPGIPEPDKFTNVVFPCILVRTYSNPNKYMNENYDKDLMNNYTKSYDSITDKNMGAKRFKNYDLFSTFKTDKEGTIKFLEDFLKLNLVNDGACAIQNNTLLTIFNIFDSRIYLDILYNLLPEDVKKDKYPTEDGFVKEIRARINRNSRSVNVYKPDTNPYEGNDTPTSKKVMEHAINSISELGDMSITDMQYCEHYRDTVVSEINCLNDIMYNNGTSQIAIDHYIGESYNVFGEGFLSNIFKNNKDNKSDKARKRIEEYFDVTLPEKFIEFINEYGSNSWVDMRYGDIGKVTYIYTMKLIREVIDSYGGYLEGERVLPFASFEYSNDEDNKNSIKKAIYLNLSDMSVSIANDLSECIDRDIAKPGNFEPFAKSFDEFLSKLDTGSDKVQESYVQEQELGDIPDYMRNRINLSDEAGTSPNVTTTDIQLPPDCPTNPIDDLTASIDARMNAGGGLEDMLGAGYNDNPNKNNHEGKIVYNITNNYNNSFNKDSNNTTTTTNTDSSTGKTTNNTTSVSNTNSHNDSSKNKNTDNSSRKSINKGTNGANNNNNSNRTVDSKDSSNASRDGEQTFSNGLTVQEMFAFLESEEPLSNGEGAGKPPKGDLLTAAMDADRQTLAAQQGAKRTVQKAVNTGRAILKPIARTKQWLTKIIDSLIKRDEDKVKAEIIENPSYRTALYKAMRLALKFGLTGICFTISGYLGAAYLTIEGCKLADKHRLKKEVQEEFTAELEILNDKIRKADLDDSPESRKAKWQMMRLRSKMQRMAVQSTKTSVKDPRYDF